MYTLLAGQMVLKMIKGKPNIGDLLLVTVVSISFLQMKINRTKIRFHRSSTVKIMVTFVTLDLYIPIYQVEFISC